MKKIGIGVLLLAIVAGLVAIVFFGRQHQQQGLAEQASSHSALVAKQKTSASSSKPAAASNKQSTAKPASKKVGHGQTLKYIALGDSLAAGDYTSKENMAYQYVLARYLKDTLDYNVTLDGFWQAGATITSLAQPNYNSVVTMAPNLITIEFGTNEQDQTNPNYVNTTSFKTNLANLVSGLQQDLPKANIILLTSWKAATSKDYDAVIEQVGAQYKTPVVDISSVYADSKNIAASGAASWAGSGDGYHPNDAGNAAIAKLLEKSVDRLYVQ